MNLENLKTSFDIGERNVDTGVESARTNESPEGRREGGREGGGDGGEWVKKGKENKEEGK